MNSVLLHQIDPDRNSARFYSLFIEPTLFGEAGVVRHWGRIGTSGRYRLDLYASYSEALLALSRIEQTKRRRGYVRVDDENAVHQSDFLTKTTEENPNRVREQPVIAQDSIRLRSPLLPDSGCFVRPYINP